MKKVYIIVIAVLLGITIYLFSDHFDTSNQPNDDSPQGNVEYQNIFSSLAEEEHYLYFEASLYQLVDDEYYSWFEVLYQDTELYNTLFSIRAFRHLSIDLSDFDRTLNTESEIHITYDDDEYYSETMTISVYYYDILNDPEYLGLDRGEFLTDGNTYQFDMFDNSYYVIYELLDGKNLFDNYYSHIDEARTHVIDLDSSIEVVPNKLGIDFICTDDGVVSKYHHISIDNKPDNKAWFLNTREEAYLRLYSDNQNHYDLVDYQILENGSYELSFTFYGDTEIIYDEILEFTLKQEYTITDDLFEFDVTYTVTDNDLLYIVFYDKAQDHYMSYYVQTNPN